MNRQRMKFFAEETLDASQALAAQLLPFQDKFVTWTEEENEELTAEQKFLVECKLNGATYQTIRQYFKLTSDNTIVAALKKTAMGYKWQPHISGGSAPAISNVYINRLKKVVHERCMDLNAMKSIEIMDFFVNSVRGMYYDAYKRLIDWGCYRIASSLKLPDFKFDASYFTHFARRIGLFIKSPDVLEQLRRKYCNRFAIHNFFSKFSVLMANIAPSFIYNADETGLSTKRAYKVFTTDPLYRATPSPGKEQHITAMCAFSATGDKLPLLFILAGIRNIPFASADNANYYSCSPSGWMSEHLFNLWCIIFVSHIQCKRAKMNERERNIPFILFLDGHSSRMSPFALRFFNKFNIIVIIFPAHSTHVLQPFDVSIAASLKSWYIKSLTCNLQFYRLYGQSQNMQARYARIRAFIDAWCMITPTDCQRAFASSGIYPFDESAVKMQHLIHPAGQNMYEGRTSILSSNIVSSNEFVANVPRYYRRIKWPDGSVNDIEPEINCTEAKILWETRIYEIGTMWHDFPYFPA